MTTGLSSHGLTYTGNQHKLKSIEGRMQRVYVDKKTATEYHQPNARNNVIHIYLFSAQHCNNKPLRVGA